MSAAGFEFDAPEETTQQHLIVEVGAGRAHEVAPWDSLPMRRTFAEHETYLGIDIGARARADSHSLDQLEIDEQDRAMHAKWAAVMQQHPRAALGFAQADGIELPLANDVADEVIFSNVFGHGTNSSHTDLLWEANRVLKPNGTVVLHDYTSPKYRAWPHMEGLIKGAGLFPDAAQARFVHQTSAPNYYGEVAKQFGLEVRDDAFDGYVWLLGKLSVTEAQTREDDGFWKRVYRRIIE